MKNLLVLGVTVALLYLGYDAMQPPPLPPPAAVPHAPVAPVAAPKVYFHSALDAPAMATHMTTGTSYFSTDPNSRFVAGYGYDTSLYRLDSGAPSYLVVPGGAAVAPANTSRLANVVQTRQAGWMSSVRKETPRATPNPNGSAR